MYNRNKYKNELVKIMDEFIFSISRFAFDEQHFVHYYLTNAGLFNFAKISNIKEKKNKIHFYRFDY